MGSGRKAADVYEAVQAVFYCPFSPSDGIGLSAAGAGGGKRPTGSGRIGQPAGGIARDAGAPEPHRQHL